MPPSRSHKPSMISRSGSSNRCCFAQAKPSLRRCSATNSVAKDGSSATKSVTLSSCCSCARRKPIKGLRRTLNQDNRCSGFCKIRYRFIRSWMIGRSASKSMSVDRHAMPAADSSVSNGSRWLRERHRIPMLESCCCKALMWVRTALSSERVWA